VSTVARRGRRRKQQPFAVTLFEGGIGLGGAVGLFVAASRAMHHHATSVACRSGANPGACLNKATTDALTPYIKSGITGAIVGGLIALGLILVWRQFTATRTAAPAFRRKSIPERVRHEVWRRDQGRCVDCGSRERLEFDHIVPVSRGGSNTARNIELRCELCNRAKGAQI
jgi:hypothetical protein